MARLFSWRTGRIGCNESQSKDGGRPKVALVIGITGIVGSSLAEILPRPDVPGGPWKVYGVARRPQPRWFANAPVQYIQCDVLNDVDTQEKITPLRDVTHLFWVVWVNRSTEERNCEDNGRMFQNVLDALLPNAPKLQHIVLQTGAKHYLGPFNLAGNIPIHEPPFREDMPRLPVPNFYHTLEDILFETVKKKEGLTWSVHRPNAIFGYSPWSLMNILTSLAVYATICKHENLPFRYPGNRITWEQFEDASDANGDVFNYKCVWSLLARKIGLEVVPYDGQPISMKELMKEKDPVWDAIVREHDLTPTKLDEVGNWWFADFALNLHAPTVLNINKSKERGFFGFRNTETSILYWIDKMRHKKVIP